MIKTGTRLYINITNACNTNCPFCCMYSSTENSKYMDFDTFRSIVDKYDSEFELQLEGGEPLLHPNVYLFIEYALSKKGCKKVNILTNGIVLENHIRRIVELCKWYKIPFEIKVSVNYWLIKVNQDHIRKLEKIIFATEYIENFKISLNVRKRENDEWIDEEIAKYKLTEHANSFYLQSYGKMTGSKYDKPVIVQNIADWHIFACDGKDFGQDLVARSEYEKTLGVNK